MSTYNPDRWIIIRFENDGEEIYKVMGGWYGGYLFGDSWRLNSGITEVQDRADNYEFIGSSGSVYICNKSGEGGSGLMGSVCMGWRNKGIEFEVITVEDYIKENCEST